MGRRLRIIRDWNYNKQVSKGLKKRSDCPGLADYSADPIQIKLFSIEVSSHISALQKSTLFHDLRSLFERLYRWQYWHLESAVVL